MLSLLPALSLSGPRQSDGGVSAVTAGVAPDVAVVCVCGGGGGGGVVGGGVSGQSVLVGCGGKACWVGGSVKAEKTVVMKRI